MKTFDHRVAAITGAGSGIGRCLAIQLAALGCDLAIADVNSSSLDSLAKELRDAGRKCSTHVVDVADRLQVQQFAEQAVDTHGRVHMIFNNAGVALADLAESQSYDDFHWLMNINFWGVIHGCTAFLPFLQQVDEAHIINISSLFGLGSLPSQSAYNASKFAVRGYTEALKMELSTSHVRVSCVHPGGIRTNIANAARVNEEELQLSKSQLQGSFERFAITSADKAAKSILTGVKKNRRRIIIGKDAKLADIFIRLFPGSYEKWLRLEKPLGERWAQKKEPL